MIVGPVRWNSIQQLHTLSLPSEDRNLIVTVHYYNPFEFTHQGTWTNMRDKHGITWTATPEEQAAVRRDLDGAEAWSRKENRPIYLGEFGAYDKADMPSRPLRRLRRPRGRGPGLELGVLAVRRRLHPLRHPGQALGRAAAGRAGESQAKN